MSDASLRGLGVCIISPPGGRRRSASRAGAPVNEQYPPRGRRRCFSAKVPEDLFVHNQQYVSHIFVLEIAAALLAMRLIVQQKKPGEADLNVVVLVGNDAALTALVRGSTKCPVAAQYVYAFWRAAREGGVCPWIERIPTKNNWADAPSRTPGVGVSVEFPVV